MKIVKAFSILMAYYYTKLDMSAPGRTLTCTHFTNVAPFDEDFVAYMVISYDAGDEKVECL